MFAELRQVGRGLWRQPAFAVVAVVTLGLGMGAAGTIFSVVETVLLRPLPYHQPDQLVVILDQGTGPVSPAAVTAWRTQATAFTGVGAAELWSTTLAGIDRPERLTGVRVTPDLFPLLGVAPTLGRAFRPDEETSGARVVILADRLWRRAFAADPGIVGRTVRLSGEPYVVVGVMGPAFQFPPFWATGAEFWAPLPLAERATSHSESLRAFARLETGASLGQAQAEVATIGARLAAEYPGAQRDVRVVPLEDRVVGGVRGTVLVLFVAVGCVLLIACANVAHLLLARGHARQREMAVRAALGASRSAIAGQLLAESGLLAALAAGLGLAATWGGTRAVALLGPSDIPRLAAVGVNGPVLVFLVVIAVVTAVLFGTAPALAAARVDLAGMIGDSGKGGTAGVRQSRVRHVLIASELALAVVLLVGAGLAIRTVVARAAIDPGFDPRGVATMIVSVAGSESAAPSRRAAFYRSLLARVGEVPGVDGVSAINHLPLAGDIWRWGVYPEGVPRPPEGQAPRAAFRATLPGYFATVRLPLLAGRDFGLDDAIGAPPVVIVNRALAARHWPTGDPLGRRINIGSAEQPTWATVVGVADDAVLDDWTGRPDAEFYLPVLQTALYLDSPAAQFTYLTLVVRTASGAPEALVEPVRTAITALDRDIAVSEIASLEQVVARANAAPRFYLGLLGAFATVALTLAAAGVYGVTSYAVSRRTREIGIRMALGATPGRVIDLIVRHTALVAVIGTAVGLVLAAALSGFLGAMLYDVAPIDPVTFALAPVLLILITAAAAALPAIRATRVDPVLATRDGG
ncbi:MAG: ABC transporter permease [Gemmatimonadales bacterium]